MTKSQTVDEIFDDFMGGVLNAADPKVDVDPKTQLDEAGTKAKASLYELVKSEVPKRALKVQDYDGDEHEGGRPFCATCGQYNDGEEMPEMCYCDHRNQAIDEMLEALDKIFGVEK